MSENQAGQANSVTSPDALFLAYSIHSNKIFETLSGSFFRLFVRPQLPLLHRLEKQCSRTSRGLVTPSHVYSTV
uniref:hypothetical protein n=1 Tax=Pararhizobium sp. IMCC3301 TaxID=3067904 RepID=UPI002740D695|nr:hypothetical protein [Pararhizobium sp. IMCC3301]